VLLAAAGVALCFEALRARQGQGRYLAMSAAAALAAFLLVPLANAAYRVVDPWKRPDNSAAAQFVLSQLQPGDQVLCNAWEQLSYFRHADPRLTDLGPTPPDPRQWLIVTAAMPPEERRHLARAFIAKDCTPREMQTFWHATVFLIERGGER